MRAFAILLIVVSVVLIAVGRYLVRRARKPAIRGASRSRLVGWTLTVLGGALMFAGVILW